MQPVTAIWAPPGDDHPANTTGVISYRLFTDKQLISERTRLRARLEDLTMNPGSSPAVGQVLVNMERDLERMTDEVGRRSIARHPSLGGRILRSFWSTAHVPNAG